MVSLRECVQSLRKCLVAALQARLGLVVLGVAATTNKRWVNACTWVKRHDVLRIDLISASREVRALKQPCRGFEQARGEVDGRFGRKAQLARGRLVGEGGPRRRLGACDVLREGLRDDRSVARSVDLGNDVDPAL